MPDRAQPLNLRRLLIYALGAIGIVLLLRKIGDLAHLSVIAGEHTLWGFNPKSFAEAYLTAERFPRLGIGLAAVFATLAAIIGIPHLIVNLIELARDLPRTEGSTSIERFVRRQNRVQHEYLEQLSIAEAEDLNLDRVFSEEDHREVRALVGKIAEKDSGRLGGIWNRLGSRSPDLAKRRAGDPITTFPHALLHFVFSFASFTRSAYTYTWLWNGWFALRTFFPLFHPVLALTVLIYPEFFRVATSRVGKQTSPSRLNGGLRVFWRSYGLTLLQRRWLASLRTVESVIIESEDLILRAVDEKMSREGSQDLARKHSLYQVATDRWLAALSVGADGPVSPWLSALDSKKLAASAAPEAFRLTSEAAVKIVATAASQDSSRRPAGPAGWAHWISLRARESVNAQIDPSRSRQVRIIQTTRTQLKNPKAMARAVRSMLASNLIDKPLELFFILVCYAGIEEGLLRPLQNEMFGPNSWFYLSRYVFINTYIYGVVAGIFSDTWLKIQQDTMNEGEFNDAPTGKDASRSFEGWLFRMTFWNRENSWWASQKFTVMEYILPTLKATLVTALLVNYITLGRFDLDAFLANFIVLVFLPFTGLSWKIEQGFELASAWVVRDVPMRLRPHPLVQAYAHRAIAKRRIVFNIYYKIWENITWNYLITFMNVNTTLFGTRSFSRIVFMGFTPTELVANPLRELAASSHLPAPLTWLVLQIDSYFTHDYTDGTRLIPLPEKK